MNKMYWILDENHQTKQVDLMEWALWFENDENRRVDLTEFEGGKIQISTVFLGIDHQWGNGPPLIYETMIFAEELPDLNNKMWRYSTWDEAETGHAAAVAFAQSFLAKRKRRQL